MTKICYKPKRFRKDALIIIEQANGIITDLNSRGFDLTLRQLYYQFVSKAWIPNTEKSYKKLASIISDARLAGLVSWKAIIDRTRNMKKNSHWDSPSQIIQVCSEQYMIDKWERQPYRPEVWIEKDALIGVISGICEELDVSYFSCRGYTSQSEMWSAAQRLIRHCEDGQDIKIFHLGDHDPSGIDMSRDIEDRLNLFMGREGYEIEFERLALNRDQIDMYNPPPNPAKVTDPRAGDYISRHGDVSWELDALDAQVMIDLIRDSVDEIRDEDLWEVAEQEEKLATEKLKKISDNFDEYE